MRYEIGSIHTYVDGYDIIAGLEKCDNPSSKDLIKYIKRKTAECEAKAREFFATKNRSKFYKAIFNGRFGVDDDAEYVRYIRYDDNEVERVKQLLVEVWNTDMDDDLKIQDYQDVEDYYELPGLNKELDDLLFDRIEGNLMTIDLDTPHYLYNMICRGFDEKEQKMMGPVAFGMELEDEEYIYLLTQQLLDDLGFTFNRLLLYNPRLAQKISDRADGCFNDYLFLNHVPYLIDFEEVRRDVKTIINKK